MANNLVGGDASLSARVRGLRARQDVSAHHCLHCGAPLTTPAASASGFCCAGCNYVHRLVHEHGLDAYYNIRDAVVAPVDEAVFQRRDFTWLIELQTAAEKSPGTPQLELEIQGISCAGCVWLIERLFHQQPGSLHIETDAQLGRMRLRWTPGKFDAKAFAQALHSFNYLAGPCGEEVALPESRRLVRMIGLCAAFSMNVMLFTLPVYFGMTRDFAYAPLFGLLSMVFATFSMLTGGIYFIGRAFRAVREGVMHIDLPIAVGIAGAYLGSTYGWMSGRQELVYFDFVAAFILLMLTGRWVQTAVVERNRRRLLSGNPRPRKVRINSTQGPVLRPVEELVPGNIFESGPGEVVPVESILESPGATLGTVWINGEAEARTCRQGARIPAGAVNLGRTDLSLRATQPWSASLLAQLLRPARRDTFRHVFLERVVRGYLVGIFAVAVLAGIWWWCGSHDAARTWSVVTAVLVVSCPCAIGLAFPLIDEIATTALRRRGVFVRESDLWPRLARVRKIIFDKTGTLTLEAPVLENPEILGTLKPAARAALLGLVRDNPHPISQSLYENLLASRLSGTGDSLEREIGEEIGQGVFLKTETETWSLGRPGWRGGGFAADCSLADELPGRNDAEFACDGRVLVRFSFADATRPGARAEIAALQRRGFATFILSGDRRSKVEAMAEMLGMESKNGIAEATPEAKAEWIRRIDRRDTLMLGDGANDSLAFDAALVRGTPVIHRGVLENKCDFYYLGRDMHGIVALFNVAAMRRRTQYYLLIFSVAYNLLAVGFATAGRMNPLIAAVLMPASSLATLMIAFAGMRSTRSIKK